MSETVIKELFTNGSCGTLEATKASKTKLLAQIQRFQERIRRHIDDNYVDFIPNSTSADLYLEQSESLSCSAEQLLKTTTHDAGVALMEATTELEKELAIGSPLMT